MSTNKPRHKTLHEPRLRLLSNCSCNFAGVFNFANSFAAAAAKTNQTSSGSSSLWIRNRPAAPLTVPQVVVRVSPHFPLTEQQQQPAGTVIVTAEVIRGQLSIEAIRIHDNYALNKVVEVQLDGHLTDFLNKCSRAKPDRGAAAFEYFTFIHHPVALEIVISIWSATATAVPFPYP